MLKVILSGGGTGGHIFPALAIADRIREQHPDTEFLFVGASGRMEMEKVPQAGYRIVGLDIAGLQRRLTLKNFLIPFKFIRAYFKARSLIREFQPDVVVGTGGYASSAVLYAAVRMGVPTLIQEQNNYAGLTNKWLGAKVNRICVAFDGMEQFFPAGKIIKTGNPVRKDLLNLPAREDACRHFGLDAGKPVLLVIGGSLGARTVNISMQQMLPSLADKGIQLIWQTGKVFEASVSHPEIHKSFRFIAEMNMAYAAADLVISRAGAISVSEICVAGKAAVLVPSPNVTADHQTKNARALTDKGAAVLVTDAEAPNKLQQVIEDLFADPQQMRILAEQAQRLALPDAAGLISREVLKLARK